MTLLRAADLSVSFADRILFDRLTFTLEAGERVGLVGVNGSGKSTLMKILAGAVQPDSGLLQLRRGARVTYLPQEPAFPQGATVASELSVADPVLRELLDSHAALSNRLATALPAEMMKIGDELSHVAEAIERQGGWDTEHRAKMLLDRLGVKDWDRPVSELSGGLRKRVAIARALLTRPELLLLDEPTNHLDAETTEWLEGELDALPGALLLVTHDRYFLDGLVDRIAEIGPGGSIASYPGNYQSYLEQKLVEQEEAVGRQHKRDRWIMQEVAWMRKGPQARRTKSRDRMERAKALLRERGFKPPKVAALQVVAAPRLGHTVIEAEGLSKRFGERVILNEVSLLLQAGERLGLLGPNGVGKTSFLRVLLGELEPDSGTRILGKNTRIAYYDQDRANLDPEQTVYEAASSEETVEIAGKRMALRDYLDDLLFPVPMQKTRVKALSGGERNRLLLARLFLQGANVLVLDEPTNDLDIVTLNVLEGLLLSFSGSVLLVTHDRYFLDKVATSILAFEGEGRVVRYPGNFDDYRRLKAKDPGPGPVSRPIPPTAASPALPASAPKRGAAPQPAARLGYQEKRELEGMEAAIATAEARKADLEAALASPLTYGDPIAMRETAAALETASAEVERLYTRWEALEEKSRATQA